MKRKSFVLAGSLVIIALSCSKKSEEIIISGNGGPDPCDTTNMKYTANVLPILKNNCYTCHGIATNNGSNGIILEGYDNLKVKADNGQLIGVITHAPGYPPMPQGGAKLSDCDIHTVRSWINNGTQNN